MFMLFKGSRNSNPAEEKIINDIRNNSISELYIRNLQFSDSQICRILEALKLNDSITKLSINNCGDLFEYARELDIEWGRPNVSHQVSKKIAELITENKNIHTLSFGISNIDKKSVDKILKALITNETLTHLDISSAALGHKDKPRYDMERFLSELLKENLTINKFDIIRLNALNQGDFDGGRRILPLLKEALKQNLDLVLSDQTNRSTKNNLILRYRHLHNEFTKGYEIADITNNHFVPKSNAERYGYLFRDFQEDGLEPQLDDRKFCIQ